MLALSGSHTYAIFNYEQDGLQWSDNSVIGFTSADQQFFYNHPLSQTAAVVTVASSLSASNTGIVGKLIYLLSAAGLPPISQTVPTVNPTSSLSMDLIVLGNL